MIGGGLGHLSERKTFDEAVVVKTRSVIEKD